MNNILFLYKAGVSVSSIMEICLTDSNTITRTLDDYDAELNRIEREYRENEVPNVIKAIQEMRVEVPEAERREMRLRYLEEELPKAKQEFLDACVAAAKMKNNPFKNVQLKHLDSLRSKLRKLGMDVKVQLGRAEGISPEKIAKAREFPITNLIKHVHYMAKCPFHNDKRPSLNLRNNFYFCHGCGETGDVIDFFQKLNHSSFKQAVEALS